MLLKYRFVSDLLAIENAKNINNKIGNIGNTMLVFFKRFVKNPIKIKRLLIKNQENKSLRTATLDPFFPVPPLDIIAILLNIEMIPPPKAVITGTNLNDIFNTGIYFFFHNNFKVVNLIEIEFENSHSNSRQNRQISRLARKQNRWLPVLLLRLFCQI